MEITREVFLTILKNKELELSKTYAWIIEPNLEESVFRLLNKNGIMPVKIYGYPIRYHVLAVGIDLLEVKR